MVNHCASNIYIIPKALSPIFYKKILTYLEFYDDSENVKK